MIKCGKDCLNCPLELCKYDLDDGTTYSTIKGMTNGLADRLNMILKKRHVTQKQLSKETGISMPTISHYVNDTRKPRADHIVVMCKVLHCSADWLLGLENL